jgi:rod shape-determining protein MreC
MSFLVNRTLRIGTYLKEAARASGEREKMLTEMAGLREEVRRLTTLERDNAELRSLLGFKDAHRYKLVICELVSRGDTSGWWQTLTVNKGSEDGIAPDMAVITAKGLVGRTTEVSRHATTVLLITDPTCRVSCKFSRTGAFGITRGGGVSVGGDAKMARFYSTRPCRMDYISKEQKIFENDEAVTSGLGGVYPEGLPVGTVVKTDVDPSGLYQRADIVPAADLDALRYVFVVLK